MPRPPKNRPPRLCRNWIDCGNGLPGKQITWCLPCSVSERKKQKRRYNRRAYAALRADDKVLLDPEAAKTLRTCLAMLSGAWNAYNTASEDDEQDMLDRLLDTFEEVLDWLWIDLPPSFRPRDRPGG